MNKHFAIVELPKDGDIISPVWYSDPDHYDDYGDAFDALNERVAKEGAQIFKMPKGTPPLRVSLSDREIELWVINRAAYLTITE